ncbi:EF hand domain-containing protein [Ditylenchus destructor]|uniref:EF hand domain-containing protein n=1 Tax=Ditylenchus destructor TaxID=166010 RepID=A0AAD4QU88_9BILA|nr:EF hand domain-containing protein [Ditylenchus destructor]
MKNLIIVFITVVALIRSTLAQNRLESVFRKIDGNGDGRISFEEVRAAYMRATRRIPSPELVALGRQIFSQADVNKDGFITINEARNVRIPGNMIP